MEVLRYAQAASHKTRHSTLWRFFRRYAQAASSIPHPLCLCHLRRETKAIQTCCGRRGVSVRYRIGVWFMGFAYQTALRTDPYPRTFCLASFTPSYDLVVVVFP